ncbi:MAG: hypothetical protein IKJ65_02105 [Clostridia bacterium]|nr:hypothetical protein [Clostridia bacterium]
MKEIIKMIVQAAYVLSFCGVIFSGILGAVYEIIGHAKFEQVLSAIGISKGFEQVWVVSAIMMFLLITTYLIKAKLFS